ncbi:hypothetical protein B0T17DRAFT_649895 [Bombardia bombarda]|uniref:Uncharacterized protein n=1 Tax=Bombardia bombarda TaxID=252184 RepID=A0AA40CES0_9PEZI|nr:hypothetical protein B0T17DRAFT_649895 [Bombardia bombarda]
MADVMSPSGGSPGPSTPTPASRRIGDKWNFTSRLPGPEERQKNGRVPGRNLIPWNRPRMAEKLLLNILYECSIRGTSIPWDPIAHRFHPGSTGGALIQYMNRMRGNLIAEGHLVPPVPQKPGSSSQPEKNRGYIRANTDTNDFTTVRPVEWEERMEDPKYNLSDAFEYTQASAQKARRPAYEARRKAYEGGETGSPNPSSTGNRGTARGRSDKNGSKSKTATSRRNQRRTIKVESPDPAGLDSEEEYVPGSKAKGKGVRRSTRPKKELSYVDEEDVDEQIEEELEQQVEEEAHPDVADHDEGATVYYDPEDGLDVELADDEGLLDDQEEYDEEQVDDDASDQAIESIKNAQAASDNEEEEYEHTGHSASASPRGGHSSSHGMYGMGFIHQHNPATPQKYRMRNHFNDPTVPLPQMTDFYNPMGMDFMDHSGIVQNMYSDPMAANRAMAAQRTLPIAMNSHSQMSSLSSLSEVAATMASLSPNRIKTEFSPSGTNDFVGYDMQGIAVYPGPTAAGLLESQLGLGAPQVTQHQRSHKPVADNEFDYSDMIDPDYDSGTDHS